MKQSSPPKKSASPVKSSIKSILKTPKSDQKDKKMASPPKVNRSVTVVKKKIAPKPSTADRKRSKSVVKAAPLRKRDEKAARKADAKIA